MKKTQFIHVIQNVLQKLKHNWNSQPVAKKENFVDYFFLYRYVLIVVDNPLTVFPSESNMEGSHKSYLFPFVIIYIFNY